MKKRPIEEDLQARGEILDQQPILSPPVAEDLHRRLSEAAHAEMRRSSRLKLVYGAIALAAALLLIFLGPIGEVRQASFGRVDCTVALLDSDYRSLASGPRTSADPFERPPEFVLEVAPAEEAHVAVYFFDPAGSRHAPDGEARLRASARDELLRRYPLDSYAARPEGDSAMSVLVLVSSDLIPRAMVEAALPLELEQTGEGARAAELADLRERLATELGCSVFVRDFMLDRR